MNVRIRITSAPPSRIAPDEIREAWVGVEMPAVPDGETVGTWIGNANAGGYIVIGVDAVEALSSAGKHEAAAFWGNPLPPSALRFGAEYCEVVNK